MASIIVVSSVCLIWGDHRREEQQTQIEERRAFSQKRKAGDARSPGPPAIFSLLISLHIHPCYLLFSMCSITAIVHRFEGVWADLVGMTQTPEASFWPSERAHRHLSRLASTFSPPFFRRQRLLKCTLGPVYQRCATGLSRRGENRQAKGGRTQRPTLLSLPLPPSLSVFPRPPSPHMCFWT